MKTRLAIFAVALLLLPFLGMVLSESGGGDAFSLMDTPADLAPALVTLCVLLVYSYACNWLNTRRSGNDTFKLQRTFLLVVAAASIVLGWLLVYLNHYVASWYAAGAWDILSVLVQSLLFAALAPAVLGTRALLGSSAGLLKRLSNVAALSAPSAEGIALTLLPLALLGLLGGAAWPATLFWLLWVAPLLLLLALQLLWHESTVFSGVAQGDWGRLVCAVLAGIAVGNVAVFTFQLAGGSLLIQLPNAAFAQLGYALFGLLCLQLGDVIAEHWRGKSRAEVFKKKSFPIPVVVKNTPTQPPRMKD